MFSLIITILSIVLVVALALATAYYVGTVAQQARTDSKAAAYIAQGQQVLAAAQMFHGDRGAWPDSVDQLVSDRYLSGAPQSVDAGSLSFVSPAYAAMPFVRLPWATLTPGVPQYWMKGAVSKEVCQSINMKSRGDDGIYVEAVVGLHTQCFGPSEPYTAIVYAEATDVPANSSLLQTVPAADAALQAVAANATPTVAVAPTFAKPPLWATTANGNGAITLMDAPAGTAIWGAAYTPFGQTSPRYMPTSRQPLSTPGGWTMAVSPSVEPTPPMTIASTILGWSDAPNGVPSYYGSGQAVCDARRANINWVPLVFSLTPGYTDQGVCKDNTNNQMAFPYVAYSCDTGYSLVSPGKTTCNRTGAPVYKPKDGVCAYIVSSGTLYPDTTDLDCPSVAPTIPTSCSASGGNDPVVKVNANGTVTLTQYYGGCGTSKSKTCTTTSTNAPGYYQPALIGPVTCS